MTARARHGSYLFQRPESRNYWIRLRSPDKDIVRSLHTSDKAQAEVIALPMIAEHKAALLAARPHFETTWRCERTPGLHVNPEGGHIAATERELQFFDASGAHIRTAPNGGYGSFPVNHKDHNATLNNSRIGWVMHSMSGEATPDRPSLAVKSGDDDLLETYLKHKGITGLPEKQARDVWHLFKTKIGKPLAKCDRNDGRALVAAFGDIASATAHRRLVPMVALCNLAIAEGKLTFNPFSGCTQNGYERRVPFDDADMRLIRANLHKLDKSDQLLVRLLACTGVRRGEAFAIDREQTEGGCRFVIVGTKTDQSLRRVPLPADLVKRLPKIKGTLFAGRLDSAGKRLSKWLHAIGITDPNKAPMHSFRHRAADRLRAAGCPQDIREELLGHERKTVADGYGKGHPVPVLKKWIDKIGM